MASCVLGEKNPNLLQLQGKLLRAGKNNRLWSPFEHTRSKPGEGLVLLWVKLLSEPRALAMLGACSSSGLGLSRS